MSLKVYYSKNLFLIYFIFFSISCRTKDNIEIAENNTKTNVEPKIEKEVLNPPKVIYIVDSKNSMQLAEKNQIVTAGIAGTVTLATVIAASAITRRKMSVSRNRIKNKQPSTFSVDFKAPVKDLQIDLSDLNIKELSSSSNISSAKSNK